jgi:hypothetical protein
MDIDSNWMALESAETTVFSGAFVGLALYYAIIPYRNKFIRTKCQTPYLFLIHASPRLCSASWYINLVVKTGAILLYFYSIHIKV